MGEQWGEDSMILPPSLLLPLPQDLQSRRFWREVLAEGLDTLIFMGFVLRASCPSGSSVSGTVSHPLPGGLVVVSLAQVFDEVSGTQTNPALPLALFWAQWLDPFQRVSYVLAQTQQPSWPQSSSTWYYHG